MRLCNIVHESVLHKGELGGEGELVGEAVETSNIGLGGSKGLAPSKPSCKSAHLIYPGTG